MFFRGGKRKATVALCAVVTSVVAATSWSVVAGAAGILPPSNPPSNIAPSSGDYLAAVNSGRAAEGVGPMSVSEATVSSLPIPEQIFILVNEERIDRGLQPITYLTSQLNSYAQGGAN